MDIKAKVEELIEKIKSDETLKKEFMADPIKTVETLIGIDLPDDQIKQVAEAIKAKVGLDDVGTMLKGLGGLFGKK